MAKYHAFNRKSNAASTTVPMYVITGGTSDRVRLSQLIIGASAAPADSYNDMAILRTTARGTASTSVTPNPLDSADEAATATYDTAWSGNPTITSNSELLNIAFNQRNTFIWQAIPGFELVTPATSANGLCLLSVATTAAVQHTFDNTWLE